MTFAMCTTMNDWIICETFKIVLSSLLLDNVWEIPVEISENFPTRNPSTNSSDYVHN